MKFTRILCALLALLMLMGTLAACGETTETPEATDTQAATSSSETEGETAVTDDLPDDLDYGKDEVTIISRYREGWTNGEISVAELMNEPVNDAVYERNRAVEQRLNVRIVSIEDNSADQNVVINKVSTAVKSGSDEFDIMAAACYLALNESLNGTYANLRNTEYLDFNKPYWTQGLNEAVCYRDAQYAVTGSMLLSIYRFAFVTVFNKDLFTDVGEPFLYEDVANGSWTLDRQIELVPLFHQDNGNAVQDTEGDVYGLISNDYISVDPYWSSCEVRILEVNPEGDYELVFDSAELHDVADKLLHLYYNTDGAMYNVKHYGLDEEQNDIRDMFAEGWGAMATLRIMELENESIRSMDNEFGVVPMPKYDGNQKDYGTLLHDQFTVACIPTTVKGERLDEMSAVLEAMCAISYNTVKPAYYETTLRTKIAQDPQSAEMMDIIVDKIYIDAGIIYTQALSSFHDKFRQIMGAGNTTNTVVSQYASVTKSCSRSLERMVKKLDRIIDAQE